jgi:hypothetical protein
MSEIPGVPTLVGCVCFGRQCPGACLCGKTEKALRAWSSVNGHLEPMTPEQRAWCLNEIRSVEGWDAYQMPASDADLARDVLSAWRDYVRDKMGVC